MTSARPDHAGRSVVNPNGFDVVVAGVVLAIGMVNFTGAIRHHVEGVHFVAADAVGFVLLLLWTVPLVLRRRAPLTVLAVTTSAFALFQGLGYARPIVPYGPLVALYTVSARRGAITSVAAAAAVGVATLAGSIVHHDPLNEDTFLSDAIAIIATPMVGYGVQLARTRTALLEENAAQLRREQATRTQLAIEQELTRIARELHDIVAHHVSVIVAQAGAARRVAGSRTELAMQTLASIEVTGREALNELRRLLDVLHAEQGDASRSPPPGLGQLPALAEQVRLAGLSVVLKVTGDTQPLPPGIELHAFRIVQEALTNTLKHADASRADVSVVVYDHRVELDIHDDGRARAGEVVAGQGMIGMQQRAALVGGELVAGHSPDGGFRVHAVLHVTEDGR